MDYRKHLLTLIEVFADAKNLSPSRVTTLVMNSGAVHKNLTEGKDITVGRLEDAMQWFSANWPADLDWPAHVPRPVVQPVASRSSLDEVA